MNMIGSTDPEWLTPDELVLERLLGSGFSELEQMSKEECAPK